MATPTLCFTCGQPVTLPPRLHELPDGGPCPTCRARALEAVAPALPARESATPRGRDEEGTAGEDSGYHASWRPGDYGDDPEPA